MRIALAAAIEGPVVAVHVDDLGWIDFTEAYATFTGERVVSLTELIDTDRFSVGFVSQAVSIIRKEAPLDQFALPDDTRFLQPLSPGKVLCLGRNYAAHAAEGGHDIPDEPVVFTKAPTACVGDGQPIVVKQSYGRVDHEAEIAVVIARTCKEASVEEASDYVGGYTILNDVTAREMQKADIAKGLPWFCSKSIDTFCPIGPAIVMCDGLPDPFEIPFELRVNGHVRQTGNTKCLVFSVPEIIAHISSLMTLDAGDIIATGTPEGISALTPGDTVEIDAPDIGILRNPVVEERRKRYGVPRSAVGGRG